MYPPPFAHPSEERFARVLDFYSISWLYEPRTFPLEWLSDGRVSQAFTPDFYLPQFDTYVELTTMKQGNVTAKNRKVRRLKELYPDVNVRLLYRRDLMALELSAERPPAPARRPPARPIERIEVDSDTLALRRSQLAGEIRASRSGPLLLVGVLNGGSFFAADLAREIPDLAGIEYVSIARQQVRPDGRGQVRMNREPELDLSGTHVVIATDVVNTGLSLDFAVKRLRARRPASLSVCSLLVKQGKQIVDLPIGFTGFEANSAYYVGYGMGYRGQYWNLPHLASVRL
jgi:hypoxanthine phosphoribosyltransferase